MKDAALSDKLGRLIRRERPAFVFVQVTIDTGPNADVEFIRLQSSDPAGEGRAEQAGDPPPAPSPA